MKKIIWGIFSLQILLYLACQNSDRGSNNSGELAIGEEVFKTYCILCHGADGKLGLNGAKDITVSKLTFNERVSLIKSGKNTMTPFAGILTPEQIEGAARYSMTLE
jgi:cytochrome c6